MFGNFDMNNLSAMLEQIQQKSRELDDAAASRVLTAKSGGGMVSVSANGKGEIVDITLDDSLLEDKESLQILLISALNDLIKSIEEEKKRTAMSMFGGMNPFGVNA